MKHIIQAYDLLIDELNKEIKGLYATQDTESDKHLEINNILTKALVKHAGRNAAMQAAKEIDKQFNIGFAEWVDCEYEGAKP